MHLIGTEKARISAEEAAITRFASECCRTATFRFGRLAHTKGTRGVSPQGAKANNDAEAGGQAGPGIRTTRARSFPATSSVDQLFVGPNPSVPKSHAESVPSLKIPRVAEMTSLVRLRTIAYTGPLVEFCYSVPRKMSIQVARSAFPRPLRGGDLGPRPHPVDADEGRQGHRHPILVGLPRVPRRQARKYPPTASPLQPIV